MRRCGETDLVVHNDMHRAARFMPLEARQAKAFGNDPLARKCRIPVQQNRKHLCAVLVFELILFCAHFANYNRVDRLKMRGVRGEGQVDGITVKLAVR